MKKWARYNQFTSYNLRLGSPHFNPWLIWHVLVDMVWSAAILFGYGLNLYFLQGSILVVFLLNHHLRSTLVLEAIFIFALFSIINSFLEV